MINRPLLLALLLSLPLWIVVGNYLVAIIAALLLAFLMSMCNALRVLNKDKRATGSDQSKREESQ